MTGDDAVSADGEQHELAITVAKVDTEMAKAKEELADGDVRSAHYYMGQAYYALQDYLLVEEGEDLDE